MEFVSHGEAMDLLDEQGVTTIATGEDRQYLQIEGGDDVAHLHIACAESRCEPLGGARRLTVKKDGLPNVVAHLIQKFHMPQILVIPVAKWRKVFDAVAFSMASNESWQEVDAAATVELNTRDPLLCEPGDFHVIEDLVRAILNDAEGPDQGLFLTTTAAPITMEIVPDGAIRISLGNPILADEVVEAFSS